MIGAVGVRGAVSLGLWSEGLSMSVTTDFGPGPLARADADAGAETRLTIRESFSS